MEGWMETNKETPKETMEGWIETNEEINEEKWWIDRN